MLTIKYLKESGSLMMKIINYIGKTKSKRGLSILHNGMLNRYKRGFGGCSPDKKNEMKLAQVVNVVKDKF